MRRKLLRDRYLSRSVHVPDEMSGPIHLMGISGAGMSALAELYERQGIPVTGCDSALEGHDPAHLDAGMGIRALVYSSAIPKDHPELKRAEELGIPAIRRAEALARALRGAQLIAVAGTHGKTTTTVMTTEALRSAGLNAVGIAGGRVASWDGNLSPASKPADTYVVEADEYDRSFLALSPEIAVVTNIEADHLDIYSDLEDIHNAFTQFVTGARVVVLCADDHGASSLKIPAGAEIITYGVTSPDANLIAHDIKRSGLGSSFNVSYNSISQGTVHLKVPGDHNVRNALAALSAGIAMDLTVESMAPGLESFTGVDRRFQIIGEANGVTVIDDYAHHPTEITATLKAARTAFPGRRIIAAFQPHLYTRTRDFAVQFGEALSAADVILLSELYPSREKPIPGVSSKLVADAVTAHGKKLTWQGEREQLAQALANLAQSGDVIITLGAGDITNTGSEFLKLI